LAKVPRTKSSVGLTIGPGAAFRDPNVRSRPFGIGERSAGAGQLDPNIGAQSPEVAGIPGRITQFLGQTLETVANKFLEARTLQEVTKADTVATKKLNELQLAASQDPDIWNIPKYQEQISKIRDETSELISIPSARTQFQNEFEKDAITADFNIRKTLRIRQVDSMKATMLENIETLEDAYNDASTPEERMLIEWKRDKVIQDNVSLGVIDQVEAFNFKEKIKKEWQESSIRNAIAIDATLAKEMILSGDFKDLTADETAKWLEVADKQIARNQKIAEAIRDQMWLNNEANIIENLDKTSVQDLIQAISNGSIDPEVGNDLIKWKTDPESVQYETDKKIWLEIIRDSLSPEKDLREAQRAIAKAVADKKIQVNEAAELSVQVKSLYEGAIKFKSKPRRLQKLLGATIDMFSGWASTAGEFYKDKISIVFDMTKELVKRYKEGKITEENIAEEGQSILNDARKILNPSILSNDKNGTLMMDKHGNKARVFPDGRIEEVK